MYISMSTKQVNAVLKNKNLRITPARTSVLQIFLRESSALSHADIEKKLGTDLDRVTLYRTLSSFLESGLIHKVPDEAGVQRFAYCNHDHHEHEGEHIHTHVHFNCNACAKTFCLDDIHIPPVNLPMGFTQAESVYLVKGICNSCSRK
jgi:Fur family ferric uptake transcriptional regulator